MTTKIIVAIMTALMLSACAQPSKKNPKTSDPSEIITTASETVEIIETVEWDFQKGLNGGMARL